MNKSFEKNDAGFSLLEVIISMTMLLMLMSIAGAIFQQSVGTRERQMRRTEAIVTVQSALNLISREVANTGYGLTDNGIVAADSNEKKLHFRSNIQNSDTTTGGTNEDLTYFFDPVSNAVVRFDRFDDPQTSTVIKGVSDFSFLYFDYNGFGNAPFAGNTPTTNTMRVRISITIRLQPIQGQPDNQEITYTSDVALRNSKYVSMHY